MQNPFTTTFNKVPLQTYISTGQERDIIENFSYEEPSESVIKITGVRGSGKTVLLSRIVKLLQDDAVKEKNWYVCVLTTSSDMLEQLYSFLSHQKELRGKGQKGKINISANAKVLGVGGGIEVSSENKNEIFDIRYELGELIKRAASKNKKIFIGIDEVAKSDDMIKFASEFGKWLILRYPVYLVCTGLYNNVEQLSNVKILTFFKRATTVLMGPLNPIRMCEIYKSTLSVDNDTARKLARTTKGYSYAFQVLGSLYFKNGANESFNSIIEKLKYELFSYSYEKIWEELSEEERNLLYIISDGKSHKRAEILQKMEKPNNYSMYRDRLIKRGLVEQKRGSIELALPYFGEYIKEYGEFEF